MRERPRAFVGLLVDTVLSELSNGDRTLGVIAFGDHTADEQKEAAAIAAVLDINERIVLFHFCHLSGQILRFRLRLDRRFFAEMSIVDIIQTFSNSIKGIMYGRYRLERFRL